MRRGRALHRVAQIVTATVSATCRQFKPAAPGFVNGVSKLGRDPDDDAATLPPPARVAYLARSAGR